jgi:hypothetical protein
MKFTTDSTVDVCMSSLQGYIQSSYTSLVAVFGEPTYLDDDTDEKVNVEWEIRFEDGTIATIYNWKDYDGGAECWADPQYYWHIGGFGQRAVELVSQVLQSNQALTSA